MNLSVPSLFKEGHRREVRAERGGQMRLRMMKISFAELSLRYALCTMRYAIFCLRRSMAWKNPY
jgi:hypothetical protein